MAKWQASKSDMSPRKGYIPEIDYDDYDEYDDGTQSDNEAAANVVADAFPGLDDAAKGLMGLSAVSTPRGERSPLNLPMNWEH